MHWIYLIPLGTGLASGYYTLRSSDEITSLTGVLTLICFLISLLIAPWELQLLIMVLVIAAARYYWQQLEARTDISSENAEKIIFNPTTPQKAEKKSTFPPSLPTMAKPSSSPRIYRGVSYEVKDKPTASPESTKLGDYNSPQPPVYLGLPYETAGTPVPLLDQFENKLKQTDDSKTALIYRGVIINPKESEPPASI